MLHQQQVRTVYVNIEMIMKIQINKSTCKTIVFELSSFLFCRHYFNKHLKPVWQVQWSRQDEIRVERVEALVSVSEDGRIKKWHLCRSGLECIGTAVRTCQWWQQCNHSFMCGDKTADVEDSEIKFSFSSFTSKNMLR